MAGLVDYLASLSRNPVVAVGSPCLSTRCVHQAEAPSSGRLRARDGQRDAARPGLVRERPQAGRRASASGLPDRVDGPLRCHGLRIAPARPRARSIAIRGARVNSRAEADAAGCPLSRQHRAQAVLLAARPQLCLDVRRRLLWWPAETGQSAFLWPEPDSACVGESC